MSHNSTDTLIKMINQIAENNAAYENEEAAERVVTHIKRFWARKMKSELIVYLKTDGGKLNPIARKAAEK